MKQKTNTIQPKKPKFWFKCYRGMIKATKKRVTFYYVGEHFKPGSLILSNHESTKGPLSWDFFCDQPVRLLGTEEMNSGFKRMYKYQTEVYYHQKKHWNLFLARLFCLAATPTTNLFYKGLDLISIKEGFGFKKTIMDVYTSLVDFKENIVIFPEDSSEGYLEVLKGFKEGFLLIAEYCYKKGYDVPLVPAYFKRKEHACVVGEPILYSKLKEMYPKRSDMASYLKDETNRLGQMDIKTLTPVKRK